MMIEGNNVSMIGEIELPGDKSISHRAIMLGSISNGETTIENCLLSEDTISTIECFRNMGVNIHQHKNKVIVHGVGLRGLRKPNHILYCGNSGTTMRLISGILVGQNFPSVLQGDSSLNRRPMKRIISPLREMGANIKGKEDEYPPLNIEPTKNLKNITYELSIPSAQVKSAILLASLYCHGETIIKESNISRDHTERMISYFGGDIKKEKNVIVMNSSSNIEFSGKKIYVPGDISSASFFIVGALTLKGSKILIKDVGINETRMGVVEILKKMGGNIRILNERVINNEPIGDILVKYSNLKGVEIKGDIIGRLIDEIPILAIAASLAEGKTIIRNAEELKFKESNRIKAMVSELKKMGVNVEELDDGMIIEGSSILKPAVLNTYGDHRVAMALYIAALNAKGESSIEGFNCIKISFPGFFDMMNKIIAVEI